MFEHFLSWKYTLAHVFEELVTADREDRGAVADLVRAYAHFDLDQARRFASLLPDIAVERIEDGEIEQSISRLRGARDSQDSSYLLSDTVSSAAYVFLLIFVILILVLFGL